jgi:cytochrome c553
MKLGKFKVALGAAALAGFLPVAALAGGGDVTAKAEYCTDCHGASGRGFVGWFPMPRIAGQQKQYFQDQLQDFQKKNRENDIALIMSKVHAVSPSMGAALAQHFAHLNPPPIGDGPREFVGKGKKIYDEGAPERNVPACAGCHGEEAKGSDDFPRLAGQSYHYLVKELKNWSKERGQITKDAGEATMEPLAHALSDSQLKAVSAYLSTKR